MNGCTSNWVRKEERRNEPQRHRDTEKTEEEEESTGYPALFLCSLSSSSLSLCLRLLCVSVSLWFNPPHWSKGRSAVIALAFLWHQHQPYYPDDVTGQTPMPWVRLHGVKDYYGMALHLLEFPEMHCTINLVPSLLVQLIAYTDHGASDRFLQLSRVPADGLSEEDCLYLLENFFMASPDQMI